MVGCRPREAHLAKTLNSGGLRGSSPPDSEWPHEFIEEGIYVGDLGYQKRDAFKRGVTSVGMGTLGLVRNGG